MSIPHPKPASPDCGIDPLGSRGLYVASKTQYAPMWRRFRSAGYPIASAWIDRVGHTGPLGQHWVMCLDQIRSSRALVLYIHATDVSKGALVETGAALAYGLPVFYAGPSKACSMIHHPLVTHCTDIEAALVQATALC